MKVYTVYVPGGTKDIEFEAYVRLLKEEGVDVTNMQRTPEPGTDRRWVHVWNTQAEAEQFAEKLRKRSRNHDWRVRELEARNPQRGPLGPLEVYVGRHSGGCTYSLHPTSRELVMKKFPDKRLPGVCLDGQLERS